jgi:hypothetical protein
MQYVKREGLYWIKTNEKTDWCIEIEGGYYTKISNGSTSLLVPKHFIIDNKQEQQEQQRQQQQQQEQQQNHQQNPQNHQELQELQEQELHQNHQKIGGPGNSFLVNKGERQSQVKCEKCGLEGSYIKRKVKSHYYLYIRHKTNGKIRECLISRLA